MADDQDTQAPQIAPGEAVGTAPLVLRLIASRFETDRRWSLSLLSSVFAELLHELHGNANKASEDDAGEEALRLLEAMSAGSAAGLQFALPSLTAEKALGLAHGYALKGQLPAAIAMAELALAQPSSLGDKQANAYVLLASLRERLGDQDAAAQAIEQALLLQPDDAQIRADQQRILKLENPPRP